MNRIWTKITAWVLSALLLVIAGGCDNSDEYTTSATANFEALWKIMDEHYCFFGYKDIDWDEVHNRYRLQVKDTMNQYQLFDILAKMLAEVKDGHTNLVAPFNVARYWKWYEDYPRNFNERIQENYMGRDYLIASGMKYTIFPKGGSPMLPAGVSALLKDSIGYVYYETFSSGVGQTNLDYVLHYFRDCKGLIIDVRNNGGGSMTYSDRIASRFTKDRILSGYMLYKTSPAHDAFSEPYPVYLEPSDRIQWYRPVVVLINRRCYSATNDFVNKMSLLPGVTIIGDRTGGGSGLPFSSELPNGWSVRFSACPMLNAEKKDTEFGIDPDKFVSMLAEDEEKGEDTIINEAIRLLTGN